MNQINFVCLALTLVAMASCGKQIDPLKLQTPFEISDSLETSTYEECISWWYALEKSSPYVCVKQFGETDAGLPLHVVLINSDRNFNKEQIHRSGKVIWLINNAIHPGEPDGVDASMLYARSILAREDFETYMDQTVLMIIPFYNVGGGLNRNCCSRANQNGPESYGFRGNARNLDLNRDFIKLDSRNAQSFIALFNAWDPDVYLETHVSNGADYPYTMTYLISHPDKLSPALRNVLRHDLEKGLNERMTAQGDPMIPYVNVFNNPPDSGYGAFYDSPKYSTGYAALMHSFGFLTETHMLKPFKQRVASTLRFMTNLGELTQLHGSEIKQARIRAKEMDTKQDVYITDWSVDKSIDSNLMFNGYRAYYDTSKVTGLPQLYYDQSHQWNHTIPYWHRLKPKHEIKAPSLYLVPIGWKEVIDRLQWNGVKLELLEQDTNLLVVSKSIVSYQTTTKPYEGHYVHFNTETSSTSQSVNLKKGSYYLASLSQPKRRFMIEVLEPEGPDSYFNWNFYDEILQQKEGFSSYVFDSVAEALLSDRAIKAKYEAFMATDTSKNSYARLNFLYKLSPHYERDRHLVYPVLRVE